MVQSETQMTSSLRTMGVGATLNMFGGVMGLKGKTSLVAIGITGLLVFSFQNCGGGFDLQEEVLYEQGLLGSIKALDEKVLPGLLDTSTLAVWYKSDDPEFKKNEIVDADQWSFVLAADTAATGTLLKINTELPEEPTEIVEECSISVVDGKIRATRRHTLSVDYEEYLEVPLPLVGDKMVIAAAFGRNASEIKLMLNGVMQSGTIVKTGTPNFFEPMKKVVSSSPTSGMVYEYVVYAGGALFPQKTKLSLEEMNVISRYIAGNNLIPNVILDPSLIPSNGPVIETPEFVAAKAVIDAKCIHCHKPGGTSPDLVGLSASKAVSQKLVVKGNAVSSKLYYRLKNASGTGPQNMPTDADFSSAEAKAVEDWINSL